MATVSDCYKDVALFIVCWSLGYGRDKTVSRHSYPPPRYTNPCFKPYFIPIISRSPFLFIHSLSYRSLPYSLAGEIFPCKGTASFGRQVPLSANRLVYLPGSLPKSKMTFLSPPCCAVGLGIPFNPRRFPCLSLIFPLSGLHVKSIPTRKPEQLPTKGKKKFNEPIKISDYAKLGKYSVCGRGRRTGN